MFGNVFLLFKNQHVGLTKIFNSVKRWFHSTIARIKTTHRLVLSTMTFFSNFISVKLLCI